MNYIVTFNTGRNGLFKIEFCRLSLCHQKSISIRFTLIPTLLLATLDTKQLNQFKLHVLVTSHLPCCVFRLLFSNNKRQKLRNVLFLMIDRYAVIDLFEYIRSI